MILFELIVSFLGVVFDLLLGQKLSRGDVDLDIGIKMGTATERTVIGFRLGLGFAWMELSLTFLFGCLLFDRVGWWRETFWFLGQI